MYNLRQSKTKKIICSFVLVFGMLLSVLSGYNFNFYNVRTVSAADGSYNNEHISESIFEEGSSNKNYYSFYTSSTSKPATANGWTKLESDSTNYDNIKHGIVDLKDETTWNSETYQTSRPTFLAPNNTDSAYYKTLMINSYNGAGALGYKSNDISLASDSFYQITVTLYTHRTYNTDSTIKTDPRASIYVTGLVEDKEENRETLDKLQFEEITTLTGLKTYAFYIATGAEKTVNIELWLGSKNSFTEGAVFFHNVDVKRCSESYYNDYFVDQLTDEEDDTHNFISLSREKTAVVSNSSFENIPYDGWTTLSQSTSVDQICEPVDVTNYTYENIAAPGSNCTGNNEFALLMYNKEAGYQGVESTTFTVQHHQYYRLSFWAKSNCNVGYGATVYLVDKTENTTVENATLSLATTYTTNDNKFRNDWTNYNFYIYGPTFGSKDVTIQIWLGTTENQSDGYVFVDDFTIENINYKDFNTNSSSSNSATFNLNKVNDGLKITNGMFNVTENKETAASFPLTPADWKRTGDDYNTFSGVVNTKDWDAHVEDFYNEGGVAPTNPGKLPYMMGDDNNVLMIGSASETNTQSYETSSLAIAPNSYFLISFYVFTDYNRNMQGKDYGASVKFASTKMVILDYKNIYFDDNEWHKFEFYIANTTNNEVTGTLTLTFEGVTRYVFFDDVIASDSNETAYRTCGSYKDPDTTYLQVDLSKDKFDNRTYNSAYDLQTPNSWEATEESNQTVTHSGIISTEHAFIRDLDNTISGNENVLYINSTHDVYYSFVSKETQLFSAQTYYKISINILTRNIIQDEAKEGVVYGASFGLKEPNNIQFKSINTNGLWKTYTIYICPEKDINSAIMLSLGSSAEATSGEVLFDNLVIETIDSEAYLNAIGSTENDYYRAFINYVPEEETTEEETSEWNNDFNWLIIPSLITALAIVIAVVGFYVKKITFSRKPKIKTNYDRRKTLDKDIDKREQIALRKQIIAELNEELVAIDKEIEEYKLLASQKFEVIKERILAEQEKIKKQKLEIEIRKKEAKAEREKELKANPELLKNAKAEKDFANFIAKLDKQELALQKQLNVQDVKLAAAEQPDNIKLNSFLERKEYIKNEIAKIEAEIEALAKEEEDMWAEYKAAKAEAKKKKAEYKEQQKTSKAKTTKQPTEKVKSKKESSVKTKDTEEKKEETDSKDA
ncbi:MAG: hypothetical protein E7354_02025 [Clostridiales bacterium]|nr:hypothetical protein [Clostridiales bacterium]